MKAEVPQAHRAPTPLSVHSAVRITRDLLSALAHLDAKNIMHRVSAGVA